MKIKSLIQLTSAAALLPFTASAATITWTGGTTDYETGTNWDAGVPTNDTSTDVATFTGGIVDLASDRAVSGLDFDSGTTLTGLGNLEVGNDGITVDGNSTISTAGLILNQATAITLNGTLDISSVLTGTGDLTVTAGTATAFSMTGTNGDDSSSGYSGNVTFDGIDATVGRYFVGNTGVGTNTLSLLNGASISANSHLNMGSRNIIISGGAQINQYGSNNIYGLDGIISGTGGLTFGHVGGGNRDKVQLQGTANTFTGGVTIDAVDVHTSGSGSLGDAGNTITIKNGGFLNALGGDDVANRDIVIEGTGNKIQNNGGWTYTGNISGAGSLELVGDGGDEWSWNDSFGNTYSGGTTLDNVYMRVRGDTLGTGDITLKNGSKLKNYKNTHITLDNNIILEAGSGGGIVSGWGKSITLNGLISGEGELTIEPDSGTTNLNNTGNTFSGGLRIEAKTVAAGGTALGTGDITFNNATLVATAGNDLGTQAVTLEGDGNIQIYNSKALTIDGVVDGAGKLTVENDGGTLRLGGVNTYSGGTEIQGVVWAKTGSLGTGDVTLNNVNGSRGHLQNNNGAATHTNNVIISANGGRMQAGWNSNLEVTGVVSGSGDLAIVGDSGTVVLSNAANTYSGQINLQDNNSKLSVESLGAGATVIGHADATFTYTGDADFDGAQAFFGTTVIASGATVTGAGSLAGNLTLETGSLFIFSETDTLTVSGAVSLFAGFGVDDIQGLGSGTAVGTYVLIDGTASDFSGVDNFGAANQFDIGGGKFAYFQNGSLELVVVPEPGTFALLAGMLALSSVMIRRRSRA
ncbi:MAG: beta strand repeat-containing protein [Opitutaceae bacterium]